MDFHHTPKYFANQDFSRSTSMHHNQHPSQFSRFLSNDNHQFFMQQRTLLPNTFGQMNLNPDDDDDDGDDENEDDDDGRTPINDRPSLKFPKE